jgi:hypothetical protein
VILPQQEKFVEDNLFVFVERLLCKALSWFYKELTQRVRVSVGRCLSYIEGCCSCTVHIWLQRGLSQCVKDYFGLLA